MHKQKEEELEKVRKAVALQVKQTTVDRQVAHRLSHAEHTATPVL